MMRLVAAAWLVLAAAPAVAADRYAVVITGAAGGEAYAKKYDAWRTSFVSTLGDKLGFDDSHLFVLAETESAGVAQATRQQVLRLFGDLRNRVAKDDLLFVLLIGHGTSFDGEDGKFNLVGPDLRASEWADLLRPIRGRIAFVDTTGASFPFMTRLAARGRLVLTATDSAAQQFETVFPEYFIKAFDEAAADLDKNGRASLWEAFSYASAGVRQWYEERGQLPTERPLLDDDGDGIGREAQNPGGTDGAIARAMYLDSDVPPGADEAGVGQLVRQRAVLEAEIEALKGRKDAMSPDDYEAELERLLLELARISQQIRAKS